MSTIALLLETSGPACSVAVARIGGGGAGGGVAFGVLAEALDETPMRHTARVLPLIREAFAKTGGGDDGDGSGGATGNRLALADVGVVGVSGGPGSYTALRAGLSSAKGVCLALGVPLIQVSTLDALAAAGLVGGEAATMHGDGDGGSNGDGGSDPFLVAAIHARKNEVYYARYDGAGRRLTAPATTVVDAAWIARASRDGRLRVVGPPSVREVFSTYREVHFTERARRARNLLSACALRLSRAEFSPLDAAVPEYLKPPHITSAKARL